MLASDPRLGRLLGSTLATRKPQPFCSRFPPVRVPVPCSAQAGSSSVNPSPWDPILNTPSAASAPAPPPVTPSAPLGPFPTVPPDNQDAVAASTSAQASQINSVPNAAAVPVPPARRGILQRIKEFFVGSKFEKEKLASLGMGAFASYGVISNVTYGICLTIAWLAFVKVEGVSPLAPGKWKPFLAYYAGLWTFQNFVRPLRFGLAVALAPAFDRMIQLIGAKLRVNKGVAFAVLLVGIACTTCITLFGSIYLLGGFPPMP